MVSAVDEAIGAFKKALEDAGMLDNTLIAFRSDVSSSSSITTWLLPLSCLENKMEI